MEADTANNDGVSRELGLLWGIGNFKQSLMHADPSSDPD
jgi:hypothetical protein